MEKKEANRVQNAIEKWHAANAQALGKFHAEKKLQQYERVYQEYNGKTDLSPEEKRSLLAVHRVMAKLHRDTQKGAIENVLSKKKNPVARFVSSFVKTIRENRANRLHALKAPNVPHLKPPAEPPAPDIKPVSNQQAAAHLSRVMEGLGLPATLSPGMINSIAKQSSEIFLERMLLGEGGPMRYTLIFERGITGRYYPDDLQASFDHTIPLPIKSFENIRIAELEKRMQRIQWEDRDYFEPDTRILENDKDNEGLLAAVNGIFKDLLRLKTSGNSDAVAAHDILAYKYFKDTPAEKLISNMGALSSKYATHVSVILSDPNAPAFTPQQVYNMIQGRSVMAEDGTWYSVNKKDANKYGLVSPLPVQGSRSFNLAALLHTYGIADPSIQKRLEQGETVSANIIKNGITVQRALYADPLTRGVHIDHKESVKQGYYKPLKNTVRSDMDKYAGLLTNNDASQNEGLTVRKTRR